MYTIHTQHDTVLVKYTVLYPYPTTIIYLLLTHHILFYTYAYHVVMLHIYIQYILHLIYRLYTYLPYSSLHTNTDPKPIRGHSKG